MNTLATKLKPLQIGPITINTPLVLAPMAGVTSHAFRLLCKQEGAGLVRDRAFVVPRHPLQERQDVRHVRLETTPSGPVSVQLFGGDPALMAEAAQVVEAAGADIVDLNMGCWVPKVAKTGAGATLLKDVCLAQSVVKAMVDAVRIPVTVKIRSGWDPSQTTGIDFARRAQDAGASGHRGPRALREPGLHRPRRLEHHPARQGCRDDPRHRQRRRRDRWETPAGCSTRPGATPIMVGRAAMGNPWLFGDIAYSLETGEARPTATLADRIEGALFHLKTMAADPAVGEARAVKEMRGQITHYFKGFPGVSALRALLVTATTIGEIEDLLRRESRSAPMTSMPTSGTPSRPGALDVRAAALLALGAYLAFDLLLPLVPLPLRPPPPIVVAGLVFASTAAFMLLQLWLAQAVVNLRPRAWVSAAFRASAGVGPMADYVPLLHPAPGMVGRAQRAALHRGAAPAGPCDHAGLALSSASCFRASSARRMCCCRSRSSPCRLTTSAP